MRTIEEIKADIAKEKEHLRTATAKTSIKMLIAQKEAELRAALTASIPLDRLEEIAKAEREQRCVVLPCKRGDRIYVVDHKVRGAIRTTRLESCLVYAEDPVRVLIKCTANSEWHYIEDTYLTRAEAEAALAGQEEGRG